MITGPVVRNSGYVLQLLGVGLPYNGSGSAVTCPRSRQRAPDRRRRNFRSPAFRTLGLLLLASLGACASSEVQEPSAPQRSASAELVSLGDRMRDAGDLDVAIAIYRQAVERDEQMVLPLLRLGGSLLTKGERAQAAGAYEAALALEPENPFALRGLGRALIVLGEPERATEPLSLAIELDGKDPKTLRLLGTAFDLLGLHDEAQAAYHDGLELEPRDVDLRSNLALSLALTEEHDAAIEMMRSVANDPAATMKHQRNYALILGLAGRELEAELFAQRIFGESEIQALLRRTRNLRKIDDTTLRARAIGTNELNRKDAEGPADAEAPSGGPKSLEDQGSFDPRS